MRLRLDVPILLLIAAAATASGGIVPPGQVHNIVTVQASSQLSDRCGPGGRVFDRRVQESGGGVTPFAIPPKYAFVVTAFDWRGFTAPSNAKTAFLFRVDPAGALNGPSAQSTSTAGSNGLAGGYQTYPTGIVIRSPGRLCLGDESLSSEIAVDGTVQGFLVRDK